LLSWDQAMDQDPCSSILACDLLELAKVSSKGKLVLIWHLVFGMTAFLPPSLPFFLPYLASFLPSSRSLEFNV
jgi:hypothetical protein